MSEKEHVWCPNCRQICEKNGNVLVCTVCDATYKITKTGGAKVAEMGWKKKIEKRVGDIETLLAPEPEEVAAAEADAAAEQPEDDILPP